jgi:hypothetical protein
MSGQRLDVGEHGDVHYREKPNGRVAATAYFRNAQGVRKRLEATGGSKTAARRALLKKLEEASTAGGGCLHTAVDVRGRRPRLAGVAGRTRRSWSTVAADC